VNVAPGALLVGAGPAALRLLQPGGRRRHAAEPGGRGRGRDEEVDEVGRRTVLDQDDTDDVAVLDFSPGSDLKPRAAATRRKMLEFARRAEAMEPAITSFREPSGDQGLLKDGFSPIVFCRFVDTADYVARHLREALPQKFGSSR
jgi:hypothetical protein